MNLNFIQAIKWLYSVAHEEKKGFIASLFFATLGVACQIVPYVCVSNMVMDLFQGVHHLQNYLLYCVIAALFWCLRYLFHGISTTLSHQSTFKVLTTIRLGLSKKLTRLPMGYLLESPSGRLKNVIVERVDQMEVTLAHIVPEMGGNILISISTFLYLCYVDWRMALASVLTLPFGLLSYRAMMSGYDERFKNYVEKTKRLNDIAVEYVNGIEVIKAFNQSASSYQTFTIAAKEAANSAIDWMRSSLPYFSFAMSVFPAVLMGVLPIGALLFAFGGLTTETFIFSIILSLGIMGPLITTMSYLDDVGKITTLVHDIKDIWDLSELNRPQEYVELQNYDIQLSGVNFAYNDQLVLKNIDLLIKANTVTALVGPSGSGKSTIAKLIASLWDVSEGKILIGNTNIEKIPLKQINESIAYVTQDNYLFNDSILENIRLGNIHATDQEVENVARLSGCHEFIMQLENGYDTIAGDGGAQISGGERQRISIARAMLKDAPIIILDEATAYTDPENEAIIQVAVSKLIKGKTLIVIAHRLSTITDSDQIVVVQNGSIEAIGTHEHLLTNCNLYQQMWKAHDSIKDSTSTRWMEQEDHQC